MIPELFGLKTSLTALSLLVFFIFPFPATGADKKPKEPSERTAGIRSREDSLLTRGKNYFVHDYVNFYAGGENLLKMSLGLGIASVIANSRADQNSRNWYQDKHRSGRTDDFSQIFKLLGEGKYLIPVSVGAALLGETGLKNNKAAIVGEWGEKTARGYLVGAPALLLSQKILGASRPDEYEDDYGEKENRKKRNSAYRFWHDNNGVSGHAFVGAVPFITAARMTDRLYLKVPYYILSTLAAFSRINDDAHYLSQSVLGWWLAYLSTESLFKEENGNHLSFNFISYSPGTDNKIYGFFVNLNW